MKLEKSRNNDGHDCRNCTHAHYLTLWNKPCAKPWVNDECRCLKYEPEDNLEFLEYKYEQFNKSI